MRSIALVVLFLLSTPAVAENLRIAVASNFSQTMAMIVSRFAQQTGHEQDQIDISTGSSGKHFAQIIHGAPFDIFFSADQQRPQKLEAAGHTIEGSRFTYALGQLTLWTSKKSTDPLQLLRDGAFHHLAIANPRLAPYGRAAQQTLTELRLWQQVKANVVRGENIHQTFQFVRSGNAELGFIALSQVRAVNSNGNSFWLVPQAMYQPIEQQAVVLRDSPLAQVFVAFIKNPVTQTLIRQHGYLAP